MRTQAADGLSLSLRPPVVFGLGFWPSASPVAQLHAAAQPGWWLAGRQIQELVGRSTHPIDTEAFFKRNGRKEKVGHNTSALVATVGPFLADPDVHTASRAFVVLLLPSEGWPWRKGESKDAR